MPPIPPERLSARLAQLGFVGQIINGLEVIIPPVCDVPAGAFDMGTDRNEATGGSPASQPQHSVTLPAYQIGRFPVTVAEYACFVRSSGREPDTQRLSEHSSYIVDWQTQLARLDHPVVCVTGEDADDYAAWLAATTGYPWRLPTEAEWEKAARWDPKQPHARRFLHSQEFGHAREFPWGDVMGQAHCNVSDSGNFKTTPIGTYSSGVSPCGAYDMAGNVWEWTSSLYGPYPGYSGQKREFEREIEPYVGRRVLRGGSWYLDVSSARTHMRGFDVFGGWIDDGFRLARSIPDS